jgi:hypothetical protein
MKKILPLTLVSVVLLFSCEKEKVAPASDLIGEWNYEHHILNDGSKSTAGSYALLKHTYSDGFILYENKTGNTLYGGGINDKEFKWNYKDSRLKVIVTHADGSAQETEYVLSDLNGNSMYIHSQTNDFKFFIKKK